MSNLEEIMKNDCVALDGDMLHNLFVVTDCDGNEYLTHSLSAAKRKFKERNKFYERNESTKL